MKAVYVNRNIKCFYTHVKIPILYIVCRVTFSFSKKMYKDMSCDHGSGVLTVTLRNDEFVERTELSATQKHCLEKRQILFDTKIMINQL